MAANEPQDQETVRKDGYELTFYPGFLRRAVVREAGGTEHELFEQTRPYKLPDGKKRPDSTYTLQLKGGKNKQDITLRIDDPGLRVASIKVELYGDGHNPEVLHDKPPESVETLEVEEWPVRCPPYCDDVMDQAE
jgi:hypothetical protein